MRTMNPGAMPTRPWYRQFWPWFIITLPACAVVGGIVTLVIAARDPDGLVADDYYKQGLAINREIERDRYTASLNLSGLLRLDGDADRLVVSLESATADVQTQTLELHMVHPTRPNLDRTLVLERDAADRWSAPFDGAAHGRWHLQLQPGSGEWRLGGRMTLPDQQQAVLQPMN